MESQSSKLSVPISSSPANSSGRSKVALKPGHSLMDWIRFTHSCKDLAATGGKCLDVSSRELAKHNSKEDAWIALKGKVYNITHYLEYHPGGEDELMRGAGRDATDLFNQVHRWVNAESMLQKCFVGVLKKSWSLDVPRYLPISALKLKYKRPAIVPEILDTPPGSPGEIDELFQPTRKGKFEWSVTNEANIDVNFVSYKDENTVRIVIDNLNVLFPEIITDLIKNVLFIKKDNSGPQLLKIVKILEEERFLELLLSTTSKKLCFTDPSLWKCTPCYAVDTKNEFIYWSCKLINRTPVTHDTYLFTFLLPPGTRMWIPVGCHVHIKCIVKGKEIVRSYTPVLPSLDRTPKHADGRHIVLMIKIYPTGTLTPVIDKCLKGGYMMLSNYSGNFPEELLKNSESIVMLAAGTGITPMIKIIHWVSIMQDKKRTLLLLFFNKTEQDILWRKELETFSLTQENFQIMHILSDATEHWKGLNGKISKNILEKLLPLKRPNNALCILICGPLPFTETALRCLEGADYDQGSIYAFTGQ
ncbi:cytochrome b5 reductase 4-like isoform X2 [Stegodyphus dumicola]|uniref:cytochrome b5 reductase 4-like isoform X2 n=1 Tax=Stegodyphus dumicola TaxID=202533 RepID=UPI0015AAF085|nr:cytochrome b5 reductase 4-like isoform X2 [Stegodyphus dumicola]